jgi:hypothetical protein
MIKQRRINMERINVNKEEKKQMELSVQELRDYIKKKNGDFWLQIDFGKEGVQDGSRKDI